ncbi:MAG TPA: TonB family protein [Candidatus Sulfotelmatobacter sp.]|nr:TonB family protein [Candidatus Sulfotelmatobacter sp.]
MATASRQASSIPSNGDFPRPLDSEPATVEESPSDLDLVSILREAAASGSQPLEAIADAVADAARVLSGADGTALGLETRGTIVCRASSGDTAPPIGAPINTESGISGECLRTVSMLVCHDAMIDPRVDTEACRSLGIRSVAAVPVRGPIGALGILEAFAARPNAFDGDALRSLRDLAAIAETAYTREASTHALAARPLPANANPSTYPTPPLATEDILDGLSEPSKKRLWIVGAVALTLLLTIAVAWWSWHVPADEGTLGGQSVHAAAAEPAHPQLVRETTPKPGPGVPTTRSDRSRPQIVLNAADLKPIEVRPDRASTFATSTSPTGESTSTPSTHKADSEASVIEPPSVELAPSVNSEQLAQLSSIPAQLPSAGPRVSEGVVEPTLIHKIAPGYPMQARSERISGKVVLSATIGADGSVGEIAVVSGSPILAEAARQAVRQWRYNPAMLNGSPIVIQKQIMFLFTLP